MKNLASAVDTWLNDTRAGPRLIGARDSRETAVDINVYAEAVTAVGVIHTAAHAVQNDIAWNTSHRLIKAVCIGAIRNIADCAYKSCNRSE